MNLQQLRFVKSVAETTSFSKAAQICCVTQPTLSNAVAQFEEEMGGKIFVRTTRKVSLTRFGEHVLGYLCAVLEAQDELVVSAREFIEPRHKLLKIGFSPLLNMNVLHLALEPYRQSHPEVEIFFKECYLDDLQSRLDNEAIDVIILPGRPQSKQRESCYFYEEALCCVQNDHQLQKGVIPLKDIADSAAILTGGGCGLRGVVEDLFRQEKLELKVYPGQALSYQVLQDWALLGIGTAIVPESKLCDATRPNAAHLKLQDGGNACVAFELVWNRNSVKPSYQQDLIGHFQEVVPGIVAGRADVQAQGWVAVN